MTDAYRMKTAEVLGLVRRALDLYEKECSWLPIAQILRDAKRASTADPKGEATVELAVPDQLVQNLRGDPTRQDIFLLVRIPRNVADRLRATSDLILPGHPGWRN